MPFDQCNLYIHTPSYHDFASRWGFTIAILPWPLAYLHPRLHPIPSTQPFFCFSLGFHHCHFTFAFCIDTVSYALTSALMYTLYFPLSHYFASRWGFTIAMIFGYLARPAQVSAQASLGQPRPAQASPGHPRPAQASPGWPRWVQTAKAEEPSPAQPSSLFSIYSVYSA